MLTDERLKEIKKELAISRWLPYERDVPDLLAEVERLRKALESILLIGPEDRTEYCDSCWDAKDIAEKALGITTVPAGEPATREGVTE